MTPPSATPRRRRSCASSGYPSYFGAKPGNYNELIRDNEHYADVAASIQKVTEEVMLAMVRAIDGASFMNVPAGGKVETVLTLCDQ